MILEALNINIFFYYSKLFYLVYFCCMRYPHLKFGNISNRNISKKMWETKIILLFVKKSYKLHVEFYL